MTTYVYDSVADAYVLPADLDPAALPLDVSGVSTINAYLWTCEKTSPCVVGDGFPRSSTLVTTEMLFSGQSSSESDLTAANVGELSAAALLLFALAFGIRQVVAQFR